MESYYAKADKKVQDDRKCRTLLLKNGDIAVGYLYGGKGAQIGFRFLKYIGYPGYIRWKGKTAGALLPVLYEKSTQNHPVVRQAVKCR